LSLFEFTFGIAALILGLALTHMAAAVQKLAQAGRRVRWAPEPILLTAIIFLVIVQVWLDQWELRDRTSTTIGSMILVILKMQAVYFGAASVLPDASGREPINLFRHYDSTRWLTYGALITGLALFNIDAIVHATRPIAWSISGVFLILVFPLLYLSLILIRSRPYNIALLAGGLLFYASEISGIRLSA
jgi:hypothetical protein